MDALFTHIRRVHSVITDVRIRPVSIQILIFAKITFDKANSNAGLCTYIYLCIFTSYVIVEFIYRSDGPEQVRQQCGKNPAQGMNVSYVYLKPSLFQLLSCRHY